MNQTADVVGRRDPAEFVRPELRALSPYRLDLSPCRFKLDQNEVPWDLPRRLKRRIADRLCALDWARYPDFHSDALREALSRRLGWPAAGILVGNGSNELLGVALDALVPLGGEILGVEPSFGLYPAFASRAGARWAAVASGRDLQLPMAELVRAVAAHPSRPLLLCSPNNPTGAAASVAELRRLLDLLRAPLLLDNAYGEFCDQDYLPLLRDYPHLVILRTFSKAWSLAGLRLGYLLGQPSLVEELLKVKLPYNVSLATALAGEAVLAADDVARRRIGVLTARRAQWAAMLSEAGLEVFPSQANFVLARSAGAAEARRLRQGLEARSIRVRDVGHYAGLAGCLRVSVGDGRALRAVRAALAAIGSAEPGEGA